MLANAGRLKRSNAIMPHVCISTLGPPNPKVDEQAREEGPERVLERSRLLMSGTEAAR
jgi:hypothetical protein